MSMPCYRGRVRSGSSRTSSTTTGSTSPPTPPGSLAAPASASPARPLGKYDPSFAIGGANAYRRDVPGAEVHILDAGHFALEERLDECAALIRSFLAKLD